MALEETMLDLLKTFAGPLATVIASVTAGGVAVWFGRVQADIARRQAATAAAQKDIAYDKLKHDLFDKRYEIYQAAKAVIEAVIGKRSDIDDPKLRILCEDIDNQVHEFIVASHTGSGYSEDQHYKLMERRVKAKATLMAIYQASPGTWPRRRRRTPLFGVRRPDLA
jgi:hypothetical protein